MLCYQYYTIIQYYTVQYYYYFHANLIIIVKLSLKSI